MVIRLATLSAHVPVNVPPVIPVPDPAPVPVPVPVPGPGPGPGPATGAVADIDAPDERNDDDRRHLDG